MEGRGGSRIGKREKSSCDASPTASASRARSWETEMAHQRWPVCTRPRVRHVSGAEATPDRRPALPAPGTVNPSLKGNLCGAFVCPSHLAFNLRERLFSSTSPPSFPPLPQISVDCHFFRESLPNSLTRLASLPGQTPHISLVPSCHNPYHTSL